MLFSCSSDDKILGQTNARCIIEAVCKFFSNSPNLSANIEEFKAIVSLRETQYIIKKEEE